MNFSKHTSRTVTRHGQNTDPTRCIGQVADFLQVADSLRVVLPAAGCPTVLGDPEHHVPDHYGLLPGQLLTIRSIHDTDLGAEGRRTPPPYPSPRVRMPTGAAVSLHAARATGELLL